MYCVLYLSVVARICVKLDTDVHQTQPVISERLLYLPVKELSKTEDVKFDPQTVELTMRYQGNHVIMYLLPKELKVLQQLDYLYVTGDLDSLLETQCFPDGEHVNDVVWKVADFNNCVHYFYTLSSRYHCIIARLSLEDQQPFRSHLHVHKTFIAGPLSVPLILLYRFSHVINSLLTYLLTYLHICLHLAMILLLLIYQ